MEQPDQELDTSLALTLFIVYVLQLRLVHATLLLKLTSAY